MQIFVKILNTVATKYKFALVPIPKNYDPVLGYTLYTYLDKDGNFDYEKYKTIQTHGNKIKLNKIWATETNIKFLAHYLLSKGLKPKFGICHGTRRGLEQTWFREVLNCEVIGTEISDTAEEFPYTIQWDFHDVMPEWVGKVDFIYSNSFDHSYDPQKCINSWMSCLKPNGILILEHSEGHTSSATTEIDPFGAELHVMPYLILKWGKGMFSVKEILDAPELKSNLKYNSFLVITKNN